MSTEVETPVAQKPESIDDFREKAKMWDLMVEKYADTGVPCGAAIRQIVYKVKGVKSVARRKAK